MIRGYLENERELEDYKEQETKGKPLPLFKRPGRSVTRTVGKPIYLVPDLVKLSKLI